LIVSQRKKEGNTMKLRVLKLGTECRDKATKLRGTLTHWLMDFGGSVTYLFQPKGLDQEGQPLKKIYICEARVEVSAGDFEEIDVPFEILGSEVEDKASGFKGMAVDFVRHINGCFHVAIQPAGTIKGKNIPIEKSEFDLRGCTGKKIIQMSAEEKKQSQVEKPSPASRPLDRGLQGADTTISRRG